MGMQDPTQQFGYITQYIQSTYPDFSYIHVVEPRVDGYIDRSEIPTGQSNDFIRNIASSIPIISAGGHTPEFALEVAEKNGDLIAFGRSFISNVSHILLLTECAH